MLVLADNAWPDFDLISELQNTSQDTATSNTALEFFNLSTRLVDVERSNDNHVRSGSKVSRWDRDFGDKIFVDGVNVELQLCTDRDDGAAICDSAADEAKDRFVVLRCCFLAHEIDLVLEDDNVVKLHDLDSCEMFRSLWLGAGFVTGNEEESGVHDCGARQHGAHQNIVTRAVDETWMTLASPPAWAL